MTTDPKSNPIIDPKGTSVHPVQAPASPGQPKKEGDPKRVDQVADRLAHKGAKDEQDYERDNSKPFTK